jgi:hypothetical protein
MSTQGVNIEKVKSFSLREDVIHLFIMSSQLIKVCLSECSDILKKNLFIFLNALITLLLEKVTSKLISLVGSS